MDDPFQTYNFIKEIIDTKENETVMLDTPKRDRLTLSKCTSKLVYIFSLLLIIGPWNFFTSSINTVDFK